jgi:hypothetical protein
MAKVRTEIQRAIDLALRSSVPFTRLIKIRPERGKKIRMLSNGRAMLIPEIKYV